MEFLVSSVTDIGIVKDTNQDSHLAKLYDTPQGKVVFAILCDGMGGLEKGEIASASLVHAFANWADNELPSLLANGIQDTDIRTQWDKIITDYNEKIKLYGKRSAINLGTTITAILLTSERYYIVNVGDTRAYEIADSVKILTKDQTVVAREVELGHITEQEAKTDSRRSVLLQCVGASDSVYPDFFFGTPKLNATYMLCSDGFRHEITPQEIFDYLNPNVLTSWDDMTNNMRSLIDLDKQRQERDNITVLSIRTY